MIQEAFSHVLKGTTSTSSISKTETMILWPNERLQALFLVDLYGFLIILSLYIKT